MAQIRELADQERIRRLTSEKQTIQTQLKLLQAQIEPHFLFNTLSTIASLLDTDADAGKAMLTDLTRYLRASLTTTRAARTTLGTELELIAAYLNILKGRMGRRLQVTIDIPEEMKPLPLAPMLIQPLVENAVIHGIDPQIEGGAIEIRVQRNDGAVEIVVADTGCGFSMDSRNGGVGIANVRERLAALYGDRGRLRFTENRPNGVRAIIEVPYADNPSRDHRR
jgi:LytS/YehU family sensor histidine kinase